MPLTIDTTLLTNVCNWVGRAHNAYIQAVGDEANQESPFYWLEAVKSYVRGGNDLTTGIAAGSALTVAAQGSPNNTVNITGGNVVINGQTVAVATNATYGNATIFSQTCTDGSALAPGQFYDLALCADHLAALTVFRGPREDRDDTEIKPNIPKGCVLLAMIRVVYQAGASVITTANITAGQTLTAYAAQTTDPAARMFNDFDAGQTKLISRSAVKSELGFALTSLDKYVQTVTASQGLGANSAGITLMAWAKATHQTGTPFDFPTGFAEFVRILRNGRDHSQRLATISFTGSGTATVVDLKKVLGYQDSLELVNTTGVSTGASSSSITVTVQTTGATTAVVYSANVPANTLNGVVIPLVQTGTAAVQTPIKGTALTTAINASPVLNAQPAGTVILRKYTSLVPSSPISVTGGTSGDSFAVRNSGVL